MTASRYAPFAKHTPGIAVALLLLAPGFVAAEATRDPPPAGENQTGSDQSSSEADESARSSAEIDTDEDLEALLQAPEETTPDDTPAERADDSRTTGRPATETDAGASPPTAKGQEPLPVIPIDPLSGTTSLDASPPPRRHKLIEEIVVTATKRDTSLQQTGIAISVVDAKEMAFRQIKSIDDLQNSVPGMRVGSIIGSPQITIRGVGMNFYSGLGNPGVATHYDGVYLPRSGSALAASVDIDRVEVLRGPQGTLYGRNATGGSVNFHSKNPTGALEFTLTGGVGSYNRRVLGAQANVPIVDDTLQFRGDLGIDRFQGYGINETNGHHVGGNDALMGHVALLYEASDSLDFRLSYTQREDDGSYPYSTPLSTVTSLAGVQYPEDEITFTPRNMTGLRDPDTRARTQVGSLTANWNVSNFTLKSITGFVGHTRDENSAAAEIARFVIYLYRGERSKAWSQEFNLTSKWFDDRLNILVGAYYQRDTGATPYGAFINLDEATGLLATPTGSVLVFPPTSETKDVSEAVFIDGSWSILDGLRFIFGARKSKEARDLRQTFEPYVTNTQGGPIVDSLSRTVTNTLLRTNLLVETCEDVHNSVMFSSFNPKLGFEWDLTEDMMAYVQYQTGFKAGGYNTTTRCNQSYKPEEVTSYEIGLKSTFLDGALTANTAVFHYDYDNYQVEKIVGFGSEVDNAASAETLGGELEIRLVPAEWLAVDLAYSYLDAHYVEYVAKDNFDNPNAATSTAQDQDLSGNRLSRSPRHTVNLGITLSAPINWMGLALVRFRAEEFYSDYVYFREFNNSIERQDAYTTTNAFLTLTSTEETVSLSLFAKNIFDTTYLVGEVPFDTVDYYGGYYAPPRTLGASVSILFR